MDMLLWCLFLLLLFDESMANVSTTCYGTAGTECTDHRLSCIEPLVISITNITFGYRPGCVPVSNCDDITCCSEQTGDCFTPYNQTLLSEQQQTCNGRSDCILNSNNGLTEVSSHCILNIRHSYSKIEYQCVTNDSTTSTIGSKTTGSTTDTTNESATDVGGIVGGIVGVILVIAIVGAVIFFIKRRKADKKRPKDVHVNQNGSNPRYQTDTTLPRTTTSVYYELEKSTYNSRPSSVKPTSAVNYDYIGGDNHVKHSTGTDNYNHIGISGVTSDDEYHHLKGPNSNEPSVPDSNYNHIGSFSVAEDNYQHIGENTPRIITEDTYNHIGGHDNAGLDSDDYHHIGGSHEHQVVTDGTYNHIGGDHNEILGNDDYHHIGNGNTQPIVIDGEYSHIGGADA